MMATSSRRLVRSPCCRDIVGRPDGGEDRTQPLMAKVELDLLERPLDQERRAGVDDRPEALQRESGSEADQQLLPDPEVQNAPGMLFHDAGFFEVRKADVGEDDWRPPRRV